MKKGQFDTKWGEFEKSGGRMIEDDMNAQRASNRGRNSAVKYLL
jgi:hypothetical protein